VLFFITKRFRSRSSSFLLVSGGRSDSSKSSLSFYNDGPSQSRKSNENERSMANGPKLARSIVSSDLHEHCPRFFEYERRPNTRSLWRLCTPGDFHSSSSGQNMGSAPRVEVLVRHVP